MTATQLLQQMHDAEQNDLATLDKWQRVEYAIARRTMTHANSMEAAQKKATL